MTEKSLRGSVLPLGIVLVLVAGLGGCGGAPTGKVSSITIAAEDFAEPRIDDWMIRDLIQAKTHLKVTIRDTTGASGLLHTLLTKNSIQAYVGYDGTEFTGPLGQSYTGSWKGHPTKVASYVVHQEMTRWKLWVSPSLGYQDTYALGVTQATVKTDHLTDASSALPYAPKWTIGTDPTFQLRKGDGYQAWTHAYGFHFKAAKAMDYSLMYQALAHGSIQAAVVYSTDGRLYKLHEVPLADNKHFFPPYHGIFIVQSSVAKAWHLNQVLKPLWGAISTAQQTHLNYEVDVLKQSARSVAKTFLVKRGLLK